MSRFACVPSDAFAAAAALAGRTVRLVGYLAPSFEPGNPDWRLSEGPALPCQLCGAAHDEAAVLVRADPPPDVLPTQAVAVTGRIVLDAGRPVLVDARVQAPPVQTSPVQTS
jgi:hypothetical protein